MSPRWSPVPTTAGRPGGCAANPTGGPPVAWAWGWRPWLLTVRTGGCGRRSCSIDSAAAVLCRGTRSATCCWPASTRCSPIRGRSLGVRGRVLPMCPIALQIEADVSGLETDPRMFRVIRGQVAIATTPGKVRRVRLLPGDPPATRQAVDAIMSADLVVLGPGSWFTSVIPHVLVPGLASALRATTARRALVLNLVAEPGETAGFSAERHLHVLAQHAPDFTVHDVIIDAERVPSEREREQLRRTANLLDARVQFADVARPGTPLHDPGKLAAALDGVGGRDTGSPPPPPASADELAIEQERQRTGTDGPGRNGPRGDDAWR